MTLPELSADKSIQYATSVGLGAYLDATKLIFSCLIIIFLRFYSILHYSGCYQVLYCYVRKPLVYPRQSTQGTRSHNEE
nr:MAG TPA: hypothetical protein [Caudoviricetes sp.]